VITKLSKYCIRFHSTLEGCTCLESGSSSPPLLAKHPFFSHSLPQKTPPDLSIPGCFLSLFATELKIHGTYFFSLSLSLELRGIREHSLHFSFFNFWTVGRTPWTGDQPVAGQHKHRINTHIKHTCPRQDSNPRSQRPGERRQFMP
jgi:hypothetical protein